MEKAFSPRSVAFIGASNNMFKWGGIVFKNILIGGFQRRDRSWIKSISIGFGHSG